MIWAQPSQILIATAKWIHNMIIISSSYNLCINCVWNLKLYNNPSNITVPFSPLLTWRKRIPIIILHFYTFALVSSNQNEWSGEEKILRCNRERDLGKGKCSHYAGFMKNVFCWKYSIPLRGKQWPYLKSGRIKAVCTLKWRSLNPALYSFVEIFQV